MENKELYHHGVVGMKWGVRRTPAQLGHSPSSDQKKRFGFFKKKDSGKKGNVDDELTTEEKKSLIIKSRSAKLLYQNADMFSTQELQSAYTRLQLENNIKNLVPKEVNKGEKFVDDSTKWFKKTSDFMTSGANLYKSVNTVRKMFEGDDAKKTDWRNKNIADMSDDELAKSVKRASSESTLKKLRGDD